MRTNLFTLASGREAAKLSSKLAIGATVATVLLFSATSPSFALNARVKTEVNHFIDCLKLLLTNPVEHARVCGGGKKLQPSRDSLSTPVAGGSPPPPTTTEKDDGKEECVYEFTTFYTSEEEEYVSEYPQSCGCSYARDA